MPKSVRDWAKSHSTLLLLLGLAAFYLMTRLYLLDGWPIAWMDEPWLAQPSWMLAQGEGLRLPMFADHGGLRERMYYGLPAQLVVTAGVFEILGLGLAQARLGSVLAGLLTVVCTFLVGKRLIGRRAALIGSVFLVLEPLTLAMTRTARPDAYAMAGSMLTVFVYFAFAKDKKPGRFFVVGLCGALAAMGHLYGVFALVGIVIAEWLASGMSWGRRLSVAAASGAGLVVGLIPFAIWATLDWQAFVTQWTGGEIANKMPGTALSQYWLNVIGEPYRWSSLTPGIIALLAVGAFGLFAEERTRRSLAVIALVQAALLAVVVESKYQGYLIVLIPLLALGIGSVADRLIKEFLRLPLRGQLAAAVLGFVALGFIPKDTAFVNSHVLDAVVLSRAVGIVIVLALLIPSKAVPSVSRVGRGMASAFVLFGLTALLASTWHDTLLPQITCWSEEFDYDELSAEMQAYLPDDAMVVATPTYWLALSDYDFQALLGLPPGSVEEVMGEIGATHVIVDPWMRQQINSGFPYFGPRVGPELLDYLESETETVTVLSGTHYGELASPDETSTAIVIKKVESR